MYSPTTRLLTVLEILQSHRQMSGTELARRLEVDPRTVRRYIVQLQDMGIPVEAERGPYGAYQLQRGHRLPPLILNDAEAVALTLGLIAIREFRFPVDAAAVEGALAKLERVLPEQLLPQVRSLQEAITFNVMPPPAPLHATGGDLVGVLSSAVQQGKQVRLRYRSWGGDETERGFDPYGIVFNEGYWYTAGYCHLRRDLRTFRLDRVIALEPGEQSFERPEGFDALGHVLQSIAQVPGDEAVEVLLKTSLERAQQVAPQPMGTLEAVEEGVLLRSGTHNLGWIAHMLLEVDFPVVVVRPEALRDSMRRIAARAVAVVGEET